MPTPAWQPGTLYPPGSIVQPVSTPAPINTAITNPGFESGDSDWTKDTGWSIVNGVAPFTGTWSAEFDDTASNRKITNDDHIAVNPGQSITATCQVRQGASSAGEAGARIALAWFDSGDVEISESLGNLVDSGSGSSWAASTVTASAPAGAAFVAVRAVAFRNSGSDPLWVDTFTWNYTAPPTTAGLIYKAVQALTGSSGTTEPTWPLTAGLTVVDNEVTWEAIAASRVEWTAHPILVSGPTEPTWPLVPDATIADNTIIWRATSRRVEDVNCPNTKVVAIMAQHVFAVDEDIVRFSAAINPLDWTSESDAGFLATGLQQANSNDMAVLAPYRANLIPMNASSLQNWQVDPDPELMALIDQMDGIGSTWPKAAVAVADDLLYLSALGVRSIGVSAGSRNLSAGDIGMPIDTLVQEAIADAIADDIEPVAAYYPSLGQYMIGFGRPADSPIWVPLFDSGIEYTFTPASTAVLGSDSEITFNAAEGENGSFTISDLPSNADLRITMTDTVTYEQTEGTTTTFSSGVNSQANVAVDPLVEFSPSPLFFTLDGTELTLEFNTSEGSSGGAYSFLIEILQGSENEANTEVFVHTRTKGKAGSWSRYLFPFDIQHYGLRGNDLYFRQGDVINVFDKGVAYDELSPAGLKVEIPGFVQWNYLDCGLAGTTKQMQGFDFIGTGAPSFSIGYDERFPARFTTPYAIDPDTLVGGIIPLEVVAPTLSVRVDFAGDVGWVPANAADNAWSLSSVILYVNDLGNGP